MKAKAMKEIGHCGTHQCAPKAWRDVPNLVGDYDLDATIQHRENPNLPSRLELYVRKGERAYHPVSGYNGYSNYHGDS